MGGRKSFCISCEDVLKCFHFISPDGSIDIRNENGRIYFTISDQSYVPEITANTKDIVINNYPTPGTTLITLPSAYKSGSCKLYLNGQLQQPTAFQEQPARKLKILITELQSDEEITVTYLPA